MIRKLMISVAAASLLVGCGMKEQNEQLTARVDSLNVQLEDSRRTAEMLQEVGVMLDSIEANQNVIRSSVIEGTSYADYTTRLENLNAYVVETQRKIDELQASVEKSQSTSSSYVALANKLKTELEVTSKQIAALEEEINSVREANEQLAMTVTEKEAVITAKTDTIKLREEDIVSLETEVSNLVNTSVREKAALYFTQGLAFEEAAERTFFMASQKKKEARQQALDSYRRSYELGNDEAKPKIDELEETLDINS